MRNTFLPPLILPTALGLLALFGVEANTILTLLAIIVLIIGSALVWRPGEPPALLYVFIMQWLSSAGCIFIANAHGITVDEYGQRAGVPGETEIATAFSLIGALILAGGVRVGAGRVMTETLNASAAELRDIDTFTWFKIYIFLSVIAGIAATLAEIAPGLAQIFLPLVEIRWAGFVVFTQSVFIKSQFPVTGWVLTFCVEFFVAIGGFFSSFQRVFIYTLIAMYSLKRRVGPQDVILISIVGAVTLVVAVVWTAVKPEYRKYVSGGNTAQIVTVSQLEAAQKLFELTTELTHPDMVEAFERLASRVTNTEYFGAVITYVPRFVPHEEGLILRDAMLRPFMPRMFFPEKTIIDESAKTNKYTGFQVAGIEQGTAIAMGFWAECYVDFGFPLMMAPIFLWGLINGFLYRVVAQSLTESHALAINLSSVLVISMNYASIEKMVGQLVATILGFYLLRSIMRLFGLMPSSA